MIPYPEHLANTKAVKNQPGRRFPLCSLVRVADTMPNHMSNFPTGFMGVVDGITSSCMDVGGNYSLIRLDNNGEIVGGYSWYEASSLTLVSDDLAVGERIIAIARERRSPKSWPTPGKPGRKKA